MKKYISIAEAVKILGITQQAIIKRLKKGSTGATDAWQCECGKWMLNKDEVTLLAKKRGH